MKKHLLFLLTVLSLTTSISCSDDVDDRIPKRRPTPPTPSTEKEIRITPLTDSAPKGGDKEEKTPATFSAAIPLTNRY